MEVSNLPSAPKIETTILQVPYENLKKLLRTRARIAEKDVNAILSGFTDADVKDFTKEEAEKHLDSLIDRLQGLKRKLDETNDSEEKEISRCRARLEHLGALSENDRNARWNETRVDRIIIDYMLRCGYYDSAVKYAEGAGIKELVDLDLFLSACKVVDALRRCDASEALAWCADNRSRLKKLKSKFEFRLRVQEFVELVRSNQRMEAISYARKHLAPWGATHMQELQQAVALLAFKPTTTCPAYAQLFCKSQWRSLVEQFQLDNYRLANLTTQPLLSLYLQAGLSALKTPVANEEDYSIDDPLHLPSFRQLAAPLPTAKHMHSKLVCRISGELMTDENPPMVLPNGYVYSRKAMEEMAAKNNGKVSCPRTDATFLFSELEKAFIS
eukprot:jgi/Mesvir1/24631/Mv21940-RA.1